MKRATEHTKFVKVFVQIEPWLLSVFSNRLKTFGGRGELEPWRWSNSGQTSAARNSGNFASVRELVTGEPGEVSWRWETKICTKSVRTVPRISCLVQFGQPPYSPDLTPTDFSPFHETKHALKKISGRQGHREEPSRWITGSAFGCLRLLFCGILEGRNRAWQASEIMLSDIQQAPFISYACVCLSVLIDLIPEGNCLTTCCSQIHFCSANFVLLLQVSCVTAGDSTATYM